MKKFCIVLFALFLVNGAIAQPCLPQGISFETQAQIDSFQINYPNCTQIEGDVGIGGDDITTLSGLNVITSIGGDLYINGNTSLENLTGLENLTSVSGSLYIAIDWWGAGNPALTSLTGLQGLTSIGGQVYICRNEVLYDINDLIHLTSIGGELRVTENPLLPSISGLNNIEMGSITSLHIYGNSSLSECAVQSICEYIISPNASVYIENNAQGCNSRQEVEDACEAINIDKIRLTYELLLYPNPAKKIISISTKDQMSIDGIKIYNQLGQRVVHIKGRSENIDISTLGQGIYIVEVTSGELNIRQRLIIEG